MELISRRERCFYCKAVFYEEMGEKSVRLEERIMMHMRARIKILLIL